MSLIHEFQRFRWNQQGAVLLQAHQQMICRQMPHLHGKVIIQPVNLHIGRAGGKGGIIFREQQHRPAAGREQGHELRCASEIVRDDLYVLVISHLGASRRNNGYGICIQVFEGFCAGGNTVGIRILWQHDEGGHQVATPAFDFISDSFGRNNVTPEETECAERKEIDDQHAGQRTGGTREPAVYRVFSKVQNGQNQ